MLGLGHGVTWECVCSGDYSSMPIHAIVNHCDLRFRIGWCFFAVVLSFSGGCLDKWRVMISIEFIARLIGEALIGFDGVRRFGGYIPHITGAGWWLVWAPVSCSFSW